MTNTREPRRLTEALEVPWLPVSGVDNVTVARPMVQLPDTMNEMNWLARPVSRLPAVRAPVNAADLRQRLFISPQRPYTPDSSIHLRSRDVQAQLRSLIQPQHFNQVELNAQGLDTSSPFDARLNSSPLRQGMGAHDQALPELGSSRNILANQHNLRPPYQRPVYQNFHAGERPQMRRDGNAPARNLRSHYVPELHGTESLQFGISYSAEQGSTMPYQRLRRPIHPPVMPTLHVESNTGPEGHAMASVPQRALHFTEVGLASRHQELQPRFDPRFAHAPPISSNTGLDRDQSEVSDSISRHLNRP